MSLNCHCGRTLTYSTVRAVGVECPACAHIHNVSNSKDRVAYKRCQCEVVMSFSVTAGSVKCPSCSHVEIRPARSSTSLKRARVLKTVQTAIAHEIEEIDQPIRKKAKKRKTAIANEIEEADQPKRKKAKKKKVKRLHAFRSKCPPKIQDRIYRAQNQRMFMISCEEVDDETRKYAVLGSTGNIYNVTITQKPKCTCPDYLTRGDCCKHILLVYLKVLRCGASSPYIYQKALLSSEVKEIFQNAPPVLIGVLANDAVRLRYCELTGKKFEGNSSSEEKGKQRELAGDCPVCMEEFDESQRAKVDFCRECGNNIHKDCFANWKRGCKNQGNPVTCVYCRAAWPVTGNSKGRIKKRGRYHNLGELQGISAQRDTSSYSSKYNWESSWNRNSWRYQAGRRRRNYW